MYACIVYVSIVQFLSLQYPLRVSGHCLNGTDIHTETQWGFFVLEIG
jgi:hypothetical protein